MNLFLIGLGGAFGAVARYLSFEMIINLMRGKANASFPWHTLAVNVFGSMLAGVFYYFAIKYFSSFDEKLKNFVLVGFLGGFTTFSAFSLDFFRLFMASQEALAFSYAFLSFSLSILALFFGFYLMKIISL